MTMLLCSNFILAHVATHKVLSESTSALNEMTFVWLASYWWLAEVALWFPSLLEL